jgi:hypothetical protein
MEFHENRSKITPVMVITWLVMTQTKATHGIIINVYYIKDILIWFMLAIWVLKKLLHDI